MLIRIQNLDEKAYEIKTPTQMLRFVDSLRYHKPTEEERQEHNIPSAKERVFLHILNDVSTIIGESETLNPYERILKSVFLLLLLALK
jgi:hypothetical protein